eukprot:jgi/Botrbrau1/15963/Bobra.0294s0001.1
MAFTTPAKRRPSVDTATPNVRARLGMSPSTPARRERERDGSQGLVMMILDVTEEAQGRFNIWGKTLDGQIVLLRINDFQPYFYIAAPLDQELEPSGAEEEAQAWEQDRCAHFCQILNRELPTDLRVQEVRSQQRRPIMYYRPTQPDGTTFLQVTLADNPH